MPPKMLLIFCDGTGMDGLRSDGKTKSVQSEAHSSSELPMASEGDVRGDIFQSPDDDAPKTPGSDECPDSPNAKGGDPSRQYATNVLRLSRAVTNSAEATTPDSKRQIVLYQSGVGSQADFDGKEVSGDTIRQAIGTAVASKIRDAYAFIAQNFEEGDEICIFGFSRGAYAARKIASLIHHIGLLQRIDLGLFFAIWRELMEKKKPEIPHGTRRPDIKCVGVWDTVGAVLKTVNALDIPDTFLPPNIEVALHALSMQENREKFVPTLWNVPSTIPEGHIVKQVWFPGAHSDVGGGYERHELSDLALFWMAGEISPFVNLDLDMLMAGRQPKPSPWGTAQPHNAYEELPLWQRLIIGHRTRLENGDITANASFHESIKYAPTKIEPDPKYMITFDTVRKHFGQDFKPFYPPLNDFEKLCKKNWNSGVVRGSRTIYEHVSQLFDNP